MRGILNFAGQCCAVLAVTIGLSSYGCMDVASVNPVAELASLTVTPGTLQPAFTGGTTQYTVDLTRDTPSVRITAQPAVAGDTLTINGQATTSSPITLGPEGSTTSVSIVVSESSNNSRTYIVLLKRASVAGNNSLARLTVSQGALVPAFNANTLDYKMDVATDVTKVDVSATKSDPNAVMAIGSVPVPAGTAAGSVPNIPLGGPGTATPISIAVTAQNGDLKTYTVTVKRASPSSDNNLSALTVTPPGSFPPPGFVPSTMDYTVDVGTSVISVDVTATKSDSNAVMTIGSVTVPAGTAAGSAPNIPLGGPGTQTVVSISVTAQSGGAPKIYTITVNRAASSNNNLSALSVTPPGSFPPPGFVPSTMDYTVDVGTSVTSVDVTATKSDPNAVMAIGSVTVPAGTASGSAPNIPLSGPGTQTVVSISVTAQSGGAPKTYAIMVNRAASSDDTLSALTVTVNNVGQPLAPDFNASILDYTVNVANSVDQVTVAATKSDLNAVMLIGSVTVPAGTASGSAPNIPLGGPGTQTVVSISVTAQSGGAPKTYAIRVNRAASSDSKLLDLTVSSGSVALGLIPAFNPDQLSYTMNAGAMDSVTVSATKADPNAAMSAAGSVIAAAGTQTGQVTISPPGTDVVITVIAQDQLSTTSYTVTVNRVP